MNEGLTHGPGKVADISRPLASEAKSDGIGTPPAKPDRRILLNRRTDKALSVPIDVVSFSQAQERIMEWGRDRFGGYVVLANAHVVVTASRDHRLGEAVTAADMAAPDGAPVAWMLRMLGNPSQKRVCGPDLMWTLLKRCEGEGLSVYFYGSTVDTLEKLVSRVNVCFPNLCVAGWESPPFRTLDDEEDRNTIDRLNSSGASILFIGLGCPKQEYWMHAHRAQIQPVMLGVGAAFDFHAGTSRRAPLWMQQRGLEWLHRLLCEPRRLGKRYLVTNSLFLYGAAVQLFRSEQ